MSTAMYNNTGNSGVNFFKVFNNFHHIYWHKLNIELTSILCALQYTFMYVYKTGDLCLTAAGPRCGTAFQLVLGKWTSAINILSGFYKLICLGTEIAAHCDSNCTSWNFLTDFYVCMQVWNVKATHCIIFGFLSTAVTVIRITEQNIIAINAKCTTHSNMYHIRNVYLFYFRLKRYTY